MINVCTPIPLYHLGCCCGIVQRNPAANCTDGCYFYRARFGSQNFFFIEKRSYGRLYRTWELENMRDKRWVKYENLLYQIRPAFGGNIVPGLWTPTIAHKWQQWEGVMKKEMLNENHQAQIGSHRSEQIFKRCWFCGENYWEANGGIKINLKKPVIISGGYGVGSKENFDLLFELAHAIGAEVVALPERLLMQVLWKKAGRLVKRCYSEAKALHSLQASVDKFSILQECRVCNGHFD